MLRIWEMAMFKTRLFLIVPVVVGSSIGRAATVPERPIDVENSTTSRFQNEPTPLAVVRFATNSIRIDADHRAALATSVRWLARHPYRLLVIEGHADRRGGLAVNQRLSERRAEAVRADLIGLGADPARLVIAAYGEAEPSRNLGSSRRVVVRSTAYDLPELVRAQRPDVEPARPSPESRRLHADEPEPPRPREEGVGPDRQPATPGAGGTPPSPGAVIVITPPGSPSTGPGTTPPTRGILIVPQGDVPVMVNPSEPPGPR